MGVLKTFSNDQIREMIRLYESEECCSKDKIGQMFGTSKRIVSKIFDEHGVRTVRPGTRNKNIVVVDSAKKFIDGEGFQYIARHKDSGVEFFDANNSSGALVRYIEKNYPNVDIPSKYSRSLFYKKNGSYWHEQYFDIVKIPVKKKKGEISDEGISEMVELYQSGKLRSTHKLGEKYKLGHKKVNKILRDRGVVLNEKNDHTIYDENFFDRYDHRFKEEDGYVYKAIHKESGVVFDDYLNVSGALTRYIVENDENPVVAELLSEKRKYFIENGEYWYEKYFEIRKYHIGDLNIKKCPYCGDLIDMSVSFIKYKNHLNRTHSIDILKHVESYPEDKIYFEIDLERIKKENDDKNWVFCKICGKKLSHVSTNHLKKHGITTFEYRQKYGNNLSLNYYNFERENMIERNKNGLMICFSSKPELEIKNYLNGIGVFGETNRSYLIGKEIDFFSPEHMIGVEFNGNKWHSEWFGKKDKKYHLNKTVECNKQNIGLIHIFEDEFNYKKEILFHKLKHVFGKDSDLPKIPGRKCLIEEVLVRDQVAFLDNFHLQGYTKCTISFGAYYKGILVAVMSFKEKSKGGNEYELVRFATDYDYRYQGVASKILSHFVRAFTPSRIASFADRRWTIDKNDNLYTKLGFSLVKTLPPDYRYYNDKVDKYQRFHKFGFRKQTLSKKYGLPIEWTETEMVKYLGYDRIWDCGLFKYELVPQKMGS